MRAQLTQDKESDSVILQRTRSLILNFQVFEIWAKKQDKVVVVRYQMIFKLRRHMKTGHECKYDGYQRKFNGERNMNEHTS